MNLEMKVVDCSKCTQAVVTQSEVRVSSFCCHVKSKQETHPVDPLRQAFKNPRDQKYMTILNRTNLLTHN